jgi:serine protease Do
MKTFFGIRTCLAASVSAALLFLAVPTAPAASAALDLARQLNQAFVEVAEKASPSVVYVTVEQKVTKTSADVENPFYEMLPPEWRRRFQDSPELRRPPQPSRGAGSGILISEDGYILTNNHVVEDAQKISVKFKDGTVFKGEVRGTDPLSDLAVIKINPKDNASAKLVPAKLGNSTELKVGEFVFAIGAPYGLDYTVTVGHVSAKGRGGLMGEMGQYADQDFIQTDASINPGNSGGPLINLYGEVVGINSMIRGMNTGIGFAIPVNLAKEVSSRLIKDGKITRSRIGVEIRSLRDDQEYRDFITGVEDGVVVRGVAPGGPAEKVLKPGDVVTAIEGKPVKTSRELQEQIYYRKPGDTITLDVVRNNKPTKLKIKTEAIPENQQDMRVSSRGGRTAEPEQTSAGIRVRPLTQELAKKYDVEEGQGVVVVGVDPESPAAQRGIQPGDVVTDVDGKPVNSPREFRDILKDANLKKGVMINLISGGTSRFVILKDAGE